MRIILFEQWEKLVGLLGNLATSAAKSNAAYSLNRVNLTNNKGTLMNHAVNLLIVSGGETHLTLPDIEPGVARDFVLRVEATGENRLTFVGDVTFEGEEGALKAPASDATTIYLFSEVEGDKFLVSRKEVQTLEQE